MSRDVGRDDLPNPKKWDESDDDSGPEPMDLSATKRASSATEQPRTHKSPDVRTRDEPRGTQLEDEQTPGIRDHLRSLRYTLEVLWLRAKGALSRIVQVVGFYFIAASLLDLFGMFLTSGGIPVNKIPEWFFGPYSTLGIAPVFVFVLGLAVVWVSTSRWFL